MVMTIHTVRLVQAISPQRFWLTGLPSFMAALSYCLDSNVISARSTGAYQKLYRCNNIISINLDIRKPLTVQSFDVANHFSTCSSCQKELLCCSIVEHCADCCASPFYSIQESTLPSAPLE